MGREYTPPFARNPPIGAFWPDLQLGSGPSAAEKSPPMKFRRNRGVTLLELLVGLGIAAILVGLAIPGFGPARRTAAVRAAAFELMASLQHTRAHSLSESRPGGLCPGDSRGCRGANSAANGWRSWLESGGRPEALRHHELPAGVVLIASRAPLRFWPGTLTASPATLTICDRHGLAAPRAIVVSQTGRARFAPGEGCPS
jgi:type IV fimbrial biogenesis protein FimT